MAEILIVDQDRLFALTLIHVLSGHHHQSVLASDEKEVVNIIRGRNIDLILMDAELASRKNLHLLKHLRQANPDIPVVLSISKKVDKDDREQLRSGLYDYINKPFGHEELLLAVERGLERRRLQNENRQLLGDLKQRIRELSTFNTIAKTLNSTLNLKEVLDIVMGKVKELIKAEAWSILMLDEKTNELVFEVATGEKGQQVKEMRLGMGQGVAGWVAQNQRPVIVPDTAQDQRFFKGLDQKTGFRTRSIIATPLVSRGRLIGVVEIINKLGDASFDQKDLDLLQTLTDHAAIAIENARLYEKARRLAITDDLTGLFNSRHCDMFLKKALDEAVKKEKPLSLIFIDLDHLKEVDDTYGHLMGGHALKEVADRIAGEVNPPDMASRYGGDEYVIILPDKNSRQAMELAESIRKKIEAEPFLTDHKLSCRITASIGIANYPEQAGSADELFSKADQAMYQVKESGKNRVKLADK
ncbi:MAG: diguanylate cyclase [Candidatus Edwardsbacteria bacterium]|nr:diguanylate cyclase [Candidatus Edwardsbacteria bacterium]MBU1576892.1 diguanylate cyclase [Candidatus Edwardsbacteria bacterium]MBU2463694.1 diguanylate cyclase [Candidatus Edwardsbacteria bacterium]MBU2594253.1 diguanylate cyclase [Candidatus Edwardsbacteria bacterium]